MPEAARLIASELARSQCTFVPPGNSCARTGGSNRNCVVIIANAEATFSIDSALICKTSSFRFAHLGVSEDGKTRTCDPDPTRMRSMTFPNLPITLRICEDGKSKRMTMWPLFSSAAPIVVFLSASNTIVSTILKRAICDGAHTVGSSTSCASIAMTLSAIVLSTGGSTLIFAPESR